MAALRWPVRRCVRVNALERAKLAAMPGCTQQLRPARLTPVLRPLRVAAPQSPQVCRARVANVEIPNSKCIRYSLQYVFGVGDTTACKILQAVQIDPTRRTYDLNEDELSALREEVDTYTVEGDLRRQIALNIKRLKEIQCYRGKRHYSNLPVRGQNTKNNSRTRKGRKGMAVAGKK